MSIVIILGNNKVSCVSLTVKDKTVNILEADSRHFDDLSSFLSSADGGERTPAYRGESFLLQREQHCSSEELLRLTLSPQA